MFDQDLQNTFSDWIIFSDGDAILWQYYQAPVLDLGPALVERPCKSSDKCSGLLRRPDGTIVP